MGGHGICQDGHVQLLVDLRFLQDICSGGRSQALDAVEDVDAKESPSSEAGDGGGGALLSTLLSRVHAAIDPFDMDVYDPFLKKSRAILLSCSTVLLGHFASLQSQHAQVSRRGLRLRAGCREALSGQVSFLFRPHLFFFFSAIQAGGRFSASSTDQHNVMAMAPVAPRFATLPIGARYISFSEQLWAHSEAFVSFAHSRCVAVAPLTHMYSPAPPNLTTTTTPEVEMSELLGLRQFLPRTDL
jgi:hypothetical protein